MCWTIAAATRAGVRTSQNWFSPQGMHLVESLGSRQQVRIVATYSDGTQRDVTREAFIESGNIEVIEADDAGLLTVLRRGEAPVLE